jgi:hypothetical protein
MTKNTTDLVNDSIVQEFQGLIDQGNDFFKIELLRPAKKCYKKALELNIDQERKSTTENCRMRQIIDF